MDATGFHISKPQQELQKILYAEIIIPLALPKTYTWQITEEHIQKVVPGIRVEVVLRNKKYAGIVSCFVAKPDGFNPKPILNVLDDEPLVYEHQLKFWKWLAEYYMCSEGEVMQAAVPSYFKLTGESILIWNVDHDADFKDLNDNEFIIAEALFIRKELSIMEVQQLLSTQSSAYRVIKSLAEKEVCYVLENLKEKYKAKTENVVELNEVYNDEKKLEGLLNNWSKAPKQLELLLAYLHLIKKEGEVSQNALLKKSGASGAQLKGLIEKGILTLQKKRISRIQSLPPKMEIRFKLSSAQQTALKNIQKGFSHQNICLLHGVTASGKTQVYIELAKETMLKGRQVLYMLPEIALTAQLIRRLQEHFGGNIAVYHSKFNDNERVELWNRVKTGSVKMILGARSALFLPFKNLDLIIVDEEHESSFKQQDPAPRYHARDAAVYYGTMFNIKVLLGSATPSLETFHNAVQKKYGYVNLNERYGNLALPPIHLIDLKKFPPNQILSPLLNEKISETLKESKQIILFQNRRGYAPYIVCNVCGRIPQCDNCSVTLTYHKSKNKLTCHYCGTNYPVIKTCNACGSSQYIQKNSGTEKIEEAVVEKFSNARVARMDYDSIKGKHDHETLIKLFEQQKIDILVGTQMVVKGLDFEHVDLVGIVDADSILNFSDFRVNERSFQLMEQVSGRAGRKNEKGNVYIQIRKTDHPVMQFIINHDYEGFYHYESEKRKQFAYPPFTKMILIHIKNKNQQKVFEAANILKNGLMKNFANNILGPAEPFINKIRNEYIMEILIKLPKSSGVISDCKNQILQQIVLIQNHPQYRSVRIYADVDPI